MAKAPTSLELIANAITAAVHEREESWNSDKKAYGLTLDEAVGRATSNKDRAALVSILLSAAWNDSQEWAKDVLERGAIKTTR